MKRIFLMIVMVFGVLLTLSAQDQFKHGCIKIGSDIYDIQVDTESSIIGVSNISKNKNDIPKLEKEVARSLLPIKELDINFDVEREKEIVLDVLNNKRNILTSNKEAMGIRYIFYPDGRIMNINFILLQKTAITPQEIAIIDKRLRSELKASFTGTEYKGYPVIHYTKKWMVF